MAEDKGKTSIQNHFIAVFQMSKSGTSINIYKCNVEILYVLSGEQSVPYRTQEQIRRDSE
jgi:hypothetical protein